MKWAVWSRLPTRSTTDSPIFLMSSGKTAEKLDGGRDQKLCPYFVSADKCRHLFRLMLDLPPLNVRDLRSLPSDPPVDVEV